MTSSELTKQGKQLIVAVDHGLYMGNMAKLDDVVGVAELAVRWGCDGLIVSPGFARPVQAVAGTVPLIVSLDTFWAGASGGEHGKLVAGVDQAVRLGAAAVKLLLPTWDSGELSHGLERVAQVVRDASALCVKVVVEPVTAGEHPDDAELDIVGDAARVATEIGADILKIPFPGAERLKSWTRIAPIPVWILGGEPCNKDQVLQMVRTALRSGAGGVAMGRNVWGNGLTAMEEMMAELRNVLDDPEWSP